MANACGSCATIPLTRQFALEYALLFELLLPCLAAYRLPLPLGGTSNHFRTAALREAGAWDPFNVTEDADLGIRFARLGARTGVIASWTYEEANSALGNWMRQRARWLKGFAITWLVHMRQPRRLYRELGPAGFWTVQAVLLGTFASALLHPVFLLLTLWSIISGSLFGAPGSLVSVAMAGFALALLALGYWVSVWAGHRALAAASLPGWSLSLATMPAYWLLISVAAWRALYELCVRPHGWNKTRHGLHRRANASSRTRRERAQVAPAMENGRPNGAVAEIAAGSAGGAGAGAHHALRPRGAAGAGHRAL